MDEVFDEVVAWRGDLFAERSVLALVGHRDPSPLEPGNIAHAARNLTGGADLGDLSDDALTAMVLRLYAGNITDSGIYDDRRLNTDSHPHIEQLTPRTQRAVRAGEASFVVGEERQRVYRALAESTPPADDPYLARLDPEQVGWVEAGLHYSEYRLADARGRRADADHHFEEARRRSPSDSSRSLSPAGALLPRLLP